jgi:indole-3-glycerol phosphate synthase
VIFARIGADVYASAHKVSGSRRLSQALSEGEGISVLVRVADVATACAAEEQGADALYVEAPVAGLREATGLPVIVRGSLDAAHRDGADACLVSVEEVGDEREQLQDLADEANRLGLELVVDVRDDEELELALECVDPEIFLLSPRGADEDEEALEHVLDLLPDVPAGKLAIAELDVTTREEVQALERAGFDAVLAPAAHVASLVGAEPPPV